MKWTIHNQRCPNCGKLALASLRFTEGRHRKYYEDREGVHRMRGTVKCIICLVCNRELNSEETVLLEADRCAHNAVERAMAYQMEMIIISLTVTRDGVIRSC